MLETIILVLFQQPKEVLEITSNCHLKCHEKCVASIAFVETTMIMSFEAMQLACHLRMLLNPF
jgi:hypothetical protein